MPRLEQGIKYDAQRDPSFANKIVARRGAENLLACIQCGTCSGVCPLSNYMDYTPRRIINLAREGFHEDVLHSQTIWLCSSCYACTVECPREIKITDIMYALKREALERGVQPRRFPIAVLAREFYRMVRANGRTNESRLALNMMLRTGWLQLIGSWKLGLRLLLRGRFGLFHSESIRRQDQLARLLEDDRHPDRRAA
jgi:heterodisulfide reductase subunit C